MFITINLNLVGAIALTYYIIGAISLLLYLSYDIHRNKKIYTDKRARILSVFLIAPLFPYILFEEYRNKKNTRKVMENYRKAREQDADFYNHAS